MDALLFVLTYAAACVLLIPASLITVGAGAYWGPAKAFALVSAGSTLGATAAFLLGRTLLRDWARRKAGALTGAVDWKAVFLLRLSPIIPFNVLNYALGATDVPLPHYVLASWLGMMPGTAAYVLLGGAARRPGWLTAVGAAATLGAAWLIAREAKRRLTAYSASEPRAKAP